MKNIFLKLKEKDGFMSIIIMLFVSCLLPLFLFSLVEMNYYYSMKDKAQWVNDHMASSAVRSLNSTQLSAGTIEIDNTEAEERAKSILKSSYQLEDDLTINTDTSYLRESPILKVYVLNEDRVGTDFTTDEGQLFHIKKPSVIVYSSIQPKGIFFNKLITLQSYSFYSVNSTTKSTTTTYQPPTPPPTVTHINRTTYNMTTQNGGALNGQTIYDVVQETNEPTYTINYTDGTKGSMSFPTTTSTSGTWDKKDMSGNVNLSGSMALGTGVTPTNLVGTSIHSYDGNKRTYKVTYTLVSKQTITQTTPSPTPPPVTTTTTTIISKQFIKNY